MTPASDKATDRPVLVLFRSDLRLRDNLALNAARASGKPVVACYVRDDGHSGIRPLGAAREWWLHHSLEALAASLKQKGVDLALRRGVMADVVSDLVSETGADLVVWNRRYDPPAARADEKMAGDLERSGVAAADFEGHLLHDPARLTTGSGGPYRVYTPFWRAFSGQGDPREPLPLPRDLKPFASPVNGDRLADWNLLPEKPDWAGGLRDTWTPGEDGAHRLLDTFLSKVVDGYAEARDVPGTRTTSRLSPHLAHGEITPAQIWNATVTRSVEGSGKDVETFRKELVWREFSYNLLIHNPDLGTRNFNAGFDAFPWEADKASLEAWKRGRTGYPMVDAGMRELWQVGWMHNRVRMIVASFLIKHLMIDWREGEAWFWDTLVDADPANNAASWQWVAGSGADAAPYFRIFNPFLQGEKFDGSGAYVRRYVPELSRLPDRVLHRPWDADKSVADRADLKLGDTYPVPLVEHDRARRRALSAYNAMRGDE